MTLKTFLTEVAGEVWLFVLSTDDRGGIDLEQDEVEVLSSEANVVKRMLEIMEPEIMELEEEDPKLTKVIDKLKTILQVEAFISKHQEALGIYDDVFVIKKTKIDKHVE